MSGLISANSPAHMPRTHSCACEEEEDRKFIERCPSSSFATPETNKPVPIRPFKRFRNGERDGEEEEERSPSPERKDLSPRRLDMDQAVILACDAPPPDDEEDRVEATQPIPEDGEQDEGEIVPTPLVRCMTAAG